MSKQKKIAAIVIVAVVVLLGIFLWQTRKETAVLPTAKDEKKISVIATFYPLEEFARAVGGDAVSVESIVPPGIEPHDYEPTSRDIASIYQSDVFILNGAGIDAWAEKIRPELEKRGIKVLQMSEVIGLLSSDPVTDPHFWLDPMWAEQEVTAIYQVLADQDPENDKAYSENADRYFADLGELYFDYDDGLRKCKTRTVATSHNAFAHLAKRYDFEIISTGGFSEGTEVSSSEIAEIIEKMKMQNLRYIFFATLDSPKIAETIAREAGAKTLEFNPIEGLTEEEQKAGKNYLSIMRENLNNLRTAMQCQK